MMRKRGREAVFIIVNNEIRCRWETEKERGGRAMMERNPKHKTGLEGTAWIRSCVDAIHWIPFPAVLHAYMLRPKRELRGC
jgi:hypothetical protein